MSVTKWSGWYILGNSISRFYILVVSRWGSKLSAKCEQLLSYHNSWKNSLSFLSVVVTLLLDYSNTHLYRERHLGSGYQTQVSLQHFETANCHFLHFFILLLLVWLLLLSRDAETRHCEYSLNWLLFLVTP